MTPSSFPHLDNPTSSTASGVNVVRRRFATIINFAALAVGAVSLIAPDISAAPPSVTVTQPVQVTVVNTPGQPAQVEIVKPVEVQGVVTTLDDALHQPFFQQHTATFGTDAGVDTTARTNYYIPAGKRLIVETITVQASVQPGQKALVYMGVGNIYLSLALQSQGAVQDGINLFETIVGTHSIKLRVDGPTDPTQAAITFAGHRSADVGKGYLYTTVTGYLIDL